MNRARRLSSNFEIGEDGSDHPCPQSSVIQICRLLQGLPLGIELAASWTRFLNCQEITREIKNNLDFLADNQSDLSRRHHSLRAVFDYSWSLLGEQEQQALAALSIFQGSFDREAAGTICGTSIQQLAALVDRSLLQHRASSQQAEAHFELLEVIRHYAAEKLVDEFGPNDIVLNDKFARYYLGYLADREEDLRTSRQQSTLTVIDLEMANIRKAWRWAIDQGDVSLLETALGALSLFYYMRSRFAEGETNFTLAAGKLPEFKAGNRANIVWSRLVASQGWFVFLRGHQQEGQQLLQSSIEQLRNHEETSILSESMGFLAVVTYSLGNYDRADQLAREALNLSESFGDRNGMIMGNNILSQINYLLGNYPEARQFSEQALKLERISGNRWSMGFSLTNMGRVAFAMADYAEATNRFQEAMEIRRDLGDARGQAISLLYLGDTELAQGNDDEAFDYFEEGRQIFQEIGSQSGIASALNRLSLIASRRGSAGEAWKKSIEALRLANQGAAISNILESLTILASLLANEKPEFSERLARLVIRHPASNRRSRLEAKDILTNLSLSNEGDISQRFSDEQIQVELNEVVAELLTEDQSSWLSEH
jgi:tetratricopeptide (TPR) repeat protein